MSGTYTPQPGVWAGRPPCASCGAAYRLHHAELGLQPRYPAIRHCPEAYRPDSIERAQADLAAAEASGDPARVFVARGEVQRLSGRK